MGQKTQRTHGGTEVPDGGETAGDRPDRQRGAEGGRSRGGKRGREVMRFVDISLLELPNGWQGEADEALSTLREEVTQAEAAARASGDDPIAARKAAISAGLDRPSRQKI